MNKHIPLQYVNNNTADEVPTVPGHQLYSKVVSQQEADIVKSLKKVCIFSSSITKDIHVDRFNDKFSGERVHFRKFHGGKVRHFDSYIPPHMKEISPDTAVIMAGGNDLSERKSTVQEVLNNIIEAGVTCKKGGASKVYICSILPRCDMEYMRMRKELNKLLEGLCEVYCFDFIDCDAINLKEHICDDGVHLNHPGANKLQDILLEHLNA